MLFSATQTRNVEDLARISLRKAPLYVGVDDNKETSTVEGLEQVGLDPSLIDSNLHFGLQKNYIGKGDFPSSTSVCFVFKLAFCRQNCSPPPLPP